MSEDVRQRLLSAAASVPGCTEHTALFLTDGPGALLQDLDLLGGGDAPAGNVPSNPEFEAYLLELCLVGAHYDETVHATVVPLGRHVTDIAIDDPVGFFELFGEGFHQLVPELGAINPPAIVAAVHANTVSRFAEMLVILDHVASSLDARGGRLRCGSGPLRGAVRAGIRVRGASRSGSHAAQGPGRERA